MHPVLFHLGPILIPSYGASAAAGVLLALFLAQRTARIAGLDAGKLWSLCVWSLFAALAASRLLLIALNFSDLRLHPSWMLALAMIHHPLLAGFGALAAAAAAFLYVRWQRLPLWTTADALAAPVALGLAFEQFGALLAGSGYGIEAGAGSAAHWAVTYNDPLAALWSGAPLGVAAASGAGLRGAGIPYAFDSAAALAAAPASARRSGGAVAAGLGVAVFVTEFWRDPEGRGALLGGALNGPQAAAILLVVAGGFVLMERIKPVEDHGLPPLIAASPATEDSPAKREAVND